MRGRRGLLLAALLPLSAAAGAADDPAKNCTLPALAAGPRLNSSKELTRLTKRHKHVLVGFSAATCAGCCHFEPIYEQLLPLLPAGVQWLRVDTDRVESRGLAAAYNIEQLPALVLFRERRPTQLHEAHDLRVLAAFVRRALQPLPSAGRGSPALEIWRGLRTLLPPPPGKAPAAEGEGEDARGGDETLAGRQLVRVVAHLGADEDPEDLEDLTEAARHFASWPASFRFAGVSDAAAQRELAAHPLLKAACRPLGAVKRRLAVLALFDGEYVERQRVGEDAEAQGVLVATRRWASGGSGLVFKRSRAGVGEDAATETVVAVRPRVSCRALDAYDGLSSTQWVLRASLPPVGRFDTATSALYEKTEKPLLMLFVDTKRPELTSCLALLHRAHARYGRADGEGDPLKLLFVYIDGPSYLHRMTSLGLAADAERLPALSFNYVSEKVLTWQPSAAEYRDGSAALTAEVLDSLIQRYLHGEGEALKEGAAPKALPVPKRAPEEKRDVPALDSLSLEERLRFIPAVNQESFSEVVLDPARDVALYLYASQGPFAAASKEKAIYVNRCAERFAELGISTVTVVRMDLSSFTAPASVQISEVPALALFPAFAKEPPHAMFSGKYRPQHIMWWMEDHASRRFGLPELPHLDALETEAYWEQKARMPLGRQESVALVNEGSARRKALQSPPPPARRGRARRAKGASEL